MNFNFKSPNLKIIPLGGLQEIGKNITIFEYEDENGEFFTVLKYASSTEIFFDTENFVSEEIVYNNVTYIYCQGNENINNLLWTKNDYAYRIDGTLSKEEFLEIAKNVN